MEWLLYIWLTFNNTDPPTKYILGGETAYLDESSCYDEAARMADWLTQDLVDVIATCVPKSQS